MPVRLSRAAPSRPACLMLRRSLCAGLLRGVVPGMAALAGLAPAAAYAQAQDPSERREHEFAIPAGRLDTAIEALARTTGVTFSYDASVVAARTTQGLNGRHDVRRGLALLLAGTGVEAVALSNGAFSLRPVPVPPGAAAAPTLPAVLVRGRQDLALQEEGRAEDGYRVATVSSMGALGSMSLQDAPYSMTVVSQDLIANTHAQSPDDVYRINPTTVSQTPQNSGWAPMVKIRGFDSYDRAEDGLRRAFGYATSLEDKERVEVLSGLSGFLFGAASPGGMVNYVAKRPTEERLNRVTLGNYGGSQYYAHGDFGGQFDEDGRLGYRLNVVRQDGDTAVDDQKIDRSLASLALDWRITDRFKVELNGSYSDYRTDAPTAYWTFRDGVPRIKAPDVGKNWGQPWVRDRIESRKYMARVIFEPTDDLTLRVAHLRDYQDRPTQDHTMNSVRSPTEYYQIRIHSGRTRTESEAWQALADLSFATGPVGHKITAGYYGFTDRQWGTTYSPNTDWLGPYGLDGPTHVPQPDWPAAPDDALYYAGRVRNDNFMVGDLISLGERWSALVGINHSRIESIGLDAQGERAQPDYDKSRNSPNVSLMYKPWQDITAYATYIEGLEQGGFAPLEAANRLANMPPMVSRQKEVGIKAELGGILLGAALFDIEKAYEYTNTANVYTQDGRQRHRGGEITAFGKVTPGWSVVGGVTLLTADVHGGDHSGNAPMNVPKFVAKLYSEYALPFLPGLSATAGVYHVGRQWADEANTSRLPSYTTFDLGLRYTTKVEGRPLSLRLALNNVADRSYWLNSYYLGSPRSLAFSAQMQF